MASTSSSQPAARAAGADAAAPDPLVHVAFNQHGTHFVAATATGFHVFSCHPLVRVMHKCGPAVASPGRTVSSAELLTRSQLAVVTRGPDDDDAIDFWNGMCKEGKVASVPGAHGAVGGIRLQGEYMLVAGEEKARLCFGSNRDKDVTTGPNPLGLCAMAAGTAEGQGAGSSLVSYALPRKLVGEVQVRRRLTPGSVDVRAHDSAVACIALSHDGRLLATAGTRGTLVRVFSTADGSKLQELRRGTDGATIYCIAFSPDSRWLAVTSDKTTVHVFRLADFNLISSSPEEDGYDGYVLPAASTIPSPPATTNANQGSSLSFLKGYLPTSFSSQWSFAMNRSPAGYLPTYFSSEWSFAQFRLRKATRCSVAFDQQHPNTITIVGIDRSFYRCEFDPVKRGVMREVKYIKNFMHSMV